MSSEDAIFGTANEGDDPAPPGNTNLERLVAGRVVHTHELKDDGAVYTGLLAGCYNFKKKEHNYMVRPLDYKIPEYVMLYMRFSEDG